MLKRGGTPLQEPRGLALGVEIRSEDERQIVLSDEDVPELPLDLGINLERDEREETVDWRWGEGALVRRRGFEPPRGCPH